MSKIRLLHDPRYWSNLTAFFLEPVWREHFDIVAIEPDQAYDKKNTVIFANFPTARQWIQPWQEQGFPVVIDHTWDTWMQDSWHNTDRQLVLRNLNWSWYNESLWYRALGYANYRPHPAPTRDFLMLMNIRKDYRDAIYTQLTDLLPRAIYSYHGAGQALVGSTDQTPDQLTWQRYINPDWYDSTHFSVVVESAVQDLALSEKSFKPVAFCHPTITWAAAGLLQHLRDQGFATFDNCVDETYDTIVVNNLRLTAVVEQIQQTVGTLAQDANYFKDSETQRRIQHNRHHFYNEQLVLSRFKKEIIDPIQEFACRH